MPEDKKDSFTPNSTPPDMFDNSPDSSSAPHEQPSSFEAEPSTESTAESTIAPAPEVEPATSTTKPVVSESSAQQPLATEPTEAQSNAFVQPPKKSKKKWIIAGIASFVALILIGSGVFAYAMYQSPQKLLGDAIASLYQARAASGTVSYSESKANGTKVNVEFASASQESQYSLDVTAKINADSKEYTIKGNGVYDKDGNIYFKLDGIKDALAKTSSSSLPVEIDALIDKYENKWIKVTAQDLRDSSPQAEKTQKCYKEINQKLSQDSFKKDVESTYRKHQFVVVKDELGLRDGNVGYRIDVDTAIADEFEKTFKQTESYKELKSICDGVLVNDNNSSSRSNSSDDDDAIVNVWISQWGHKLEKVEITSDESSQKVDAVVNLDYDKSAEVKVPTETVSIKQLIEDIQTEFTKAVNSSREASVNSRGISDSGASDIESTTVLNRFF